MISKCDDIPFYPKYATDYIFDYKLRVTWFEPKFSQSYYNHENLPNASNACTLIAVILAAKCNKNKDKIRLSPNKNLCTKMIMLFAQSMLEGNWIHDSMKMKGKLENINLTVPEAIRYADKKAFGLIEWKCMLYMEPLHASLFRNLRTNWLDWIENHDHLDQDLYVILISDSRSVMFFFHDETDTITLFDSHQHTPDKGAFIAVVKTATLKVLCKWFAEIFSTCYKSNPRLYELSFLYFQENI